MLMEAIRRAGQGMPRLRAGKADAHDQLSDQLIALFENAFITASRQRSWASATFSGARHRFMLSVPPPFPALIVSGLAEHEFVLRGHIVADICVIEHKSDNTGCALEIEALTVEAC